VTPLPFTVFLHRRFDSPGWLPYFREPCSLLPASSTERLSWLIEDGSFDRLLYRRQSGSVILCAFDLVELNGNDLRRNPIEQRKTALAKLLSEPRLTSSSTSTRRRAGVQARLQARVRGYRLEAQRLTLQLGQVAALAEEQERHRLQ
jgi:hypothetical protein